MEYLNNIQKKFLEVKNNPLELQKDFKVLKDR